MIPGSRGEAAAVSGDTRSELSGAAGAVVQARDVSGGVHFHGLGAFDGAVRPWQLPAAIRDFTGRVGDVAALDTLLHEVDAKPAAVVISAIDGAAGIGKTTLAVYWAHRVRDRFPDGALYANLRGYGPGAPAQPGEVLEGFLRALGVPAARIPDDLGQRSGLYRSVLDGHRVLIVLDNANAAGQVRPLLPGSAGSLAVVTSRASLTGLVIGQGAARVNLDLLPQDEALALLGGIVGPERAAAEPAALEVIAAACARLPLALRVAGQRAASRPRLSLADVAEELADQRSRLDALSDPGDEETAVRTVFSWTYTALPPRRARLFRLLGAHPGVQIDVYAAAALADTSLTDARRELEALAAVHLLEPVARDRYLAHDLLRAYAAELSEKHDSETERHQATLRLLGHYLYTASTADHAVLPRRMRLSCDAAPRPQHVPAITTPGQASTWFDVEHANLVAVARRASDNGLHAIAWQLAATLGGLFAVRGNHDEWDTLLSIGLTSARALGDKHTENHMLLASAERLSRSRRVQEAERDLHQALDLADQLHDPDVNDHAAEVRATLSVQAGEFHRAAAYARTAMEGYDQRGEKWKAAIAANILGAAYQGLGSFDDALACHRQALDNFRTTGDQGRESWALRLLGDAHRQRGNPDLAIEHHRLALQRARENQDSYMTAEALQGLGDDMNDVGSIDEARENWAEALSLYERIGDPRADDLRSRFHNW